jgi:hypothetical protein
MATHPNDALFRKEVLASMSYPETSKHYESPPPSPLSYSCRSPIDCDFTAALRAIKDNPELRVQNMHLQIEKLVQSIAEHPDDYLAAKVDGFTISGPLKLDVSLHRQSIFTRPADASPGRTAVISFHALRDAFKNAYGPSCAAIPSAMFWKHA